MIKAVIDMDYESLYSSATKALNTQLEITNKLQERIKELEATLEQHRWIPASERLPCQDKISSCSPWVIITDGENWTIAVYDYEYNCWQSDHSPYDLEMEDITHWKPIVLPK